MAKAENSGQYARAWKGEVQNILYGPVMDCTDEELKQQMRDTVSLLNDQIDKVAAQLVEDGTFKE